MKKIGSYFNLKSLHCFVIVTVFLSSWIIARPCLGELPPNISGEKNKLIICISSPIVSLDPTNYRDRVTQVVLKNMFDSLTTRDANMKVVPQLAESWKALNDTSWEFKLRRGVKFHNGDDFTAEDVKFTLERIVKEGAMDGKTSPRRGLLEPISSVEIIDKYTIQIETEKPWAILPLMLTLQEIVPKKYMKAVGSKGFRINPIGTGPFRFVSSEEKGLLILERFEDYYGGSPGNPPVQKAPVKYLIFKTVPVQTEQIAMLKKGESDIIYNVPSATVPILKIIPDIKVLSCPATRSYFAEINCIKFPFSDPKVRHALNYAVDMQAVVNNILQGHGTILPTVLLPNAFAFNSSIKPYQYSSELAKNLLEDLGFPEGYIITINCTEGDREFASIITAFLTKIGVKSLINIVDSREPKSLGKSAEWDIFIGSWGNSTLDPIGIFVPKFKTGGRGNFSSYSNKEVDKLLSQAESTLDPEMRKNYYKRVQEIIYRDAPMIFGYAAEEFYAIRKRVKNFIPSSSGMINMHDVYIENGS